MIKIERPEMLASFKVKDENGVDTEIQKQRQALVKVVDKSTIKFGSGTGEFPEKWQDITLKQAFARAQSSKCAYCDNIETGSPLQVEHYAPKSEVGVLVSAGQEVDGLVNVRGREISQECDTGYWWRAYDWNNYLLACERCNTAWKKTLFPIEETRTGPPEEGVEETPLLLNPFDDDPLECFKYNELGAIEAMDEKGRATIETCGLDRNSLVLARAQTAARVHLYLGTFLKTENKSDLEGLLRDTKSECAFSGMVRTIAWEYLGIQIWKHPN